VKISTFLNGRCDMYGIGMVSVARVGRQGRREY
jgi:hypothetical protein